MRHLGFAAAATLAFCVALFPSPSFGTVVSTDPNQYDQGFLSDPATAIATARKRVSDGDLDGAIRELAKYVAAHPRDLEPARYLGDLYYRIPDLKAAERQYLAILLTFPSDRETHNRLGGIYASQDRLNDAISEFQKSLPVAGGLVSLVNLHRAKGDLAQFEATYQRTADDHPSDVTAQAELGKVYMYEGKPAPAVAQFQKAIDLGPVGQARPEVIYADMGSAYLDLNDPKKAVEALKRALAIAPGFYGALVNLGDAYIFQGDLTTAKNYLNQARGVNQDGFEALVDLGYIEDYNQHWKDAILLYQQAIAINPAWRDAYVNLGYDYREHGMFSLAEAALLKGLSVSPGDAWLHYLLATVYYDQGKRSLFRDEIEKAAKSDDPVVSPVAKRELARFEKA